MAGRALVFSNPEVISLINSSFIPYAGDQWYLHRQKDSDGRFFWKVAQQGHNKDRPDDVTRQGIYAAAPDGDLLVSDCFRPFPEKMLKLLRTAVNRWNERPKTRPAVEDSAAPDRYFFRQPPDGGLILNVYTRIPLESPESWNPNRAIGRDHMWITGEESRALLPTEWKTGASYPVAPSIARRLVRYHLVDNVRGEPNMWNPAHVREASITLTVLDAATGRLALVGTARMATNAEDRGYDARVQGYLAYDRNQNRFVRFDLLAWGDAWGEGTYTRGAPRGRFPLLIAFSLTGSSGADRVPPQGSRELQDYLRAN